MSVTFLLQPEPSNLVFFWLLKNVLSNIHAISWKMSFKAPVLCCGITGRLHCHILKIGRCQKIFRWVFLSERTLKIKIFWKKLPNFKPISWKISLKVINFLSAFNEETLMCYILLIRFRWVILPYLFAIVKFFDGFFCENQPGNRCILE